MFVIMRLGKGGGGQGYSSQMNVMDKLRPVIQRAASNDTAIGVGIKATSVPRKH